MGSLLFNYINFSVILLNYNNFCYYNNTWIVSGYYFVNWVLYIGCYDIIIMSVSALLAYYRHHKELSSFLFYSPFIDFSHFTETYHLQKITEDSVGVGCTGEGDEIECNIISFLCFLLKFLNWLGFNRKMPIIKQWLIENMK